MKASPPEIDQFGFSTWVNGANSGGVSDSQVK
jgi:hypothetical protein